MKLQSAPQSERVAPAPRAVRLTRLLVATAVAATALFGGVAPAAPASAAEVADAITSVTTDKSSYGYYERVTLNFDWAVPDSTSAGDTFTLNSPNELKALSLAKFPLRAADGSVVANAEWDGKTVTFTLTDYVDTHDQVSGSGFLTVQWDHSSTPETSAPIVLEFNGTAVEVVIEDKPAPTPPCTENCPEPTPKPTSRTLGKSGGWTDGSYEGTRDDTNNIWWSVRLPGSEDGFDGPIAIVDTVSAGSTIECDTIAVTTQITLENSASKTAVDPSRYTVVCSAEEFTLTLDSIAPAEFITVNYKGTITDQDSGTYGNQVVATIGGATAEKGKLVKRTETAGGVGGGIKNVSVGDYVWLDDNRDGVQDEGENGISGVVLVLTGPTGESVVDVNGNPVVPAVTDDNGAYTFTDLPVLLEGQHYTVAIDAEASSDALSQYVPTISVMGNDTGRDSSMWTAESFDLTANGARDDTLDFGFVDFQLPTLALPGEVDADSVVAELDTVEASALAYTGGSGGLPILAGGLMLLLAGAGASIAGRRMSRG